MKIQCDVCTNDEASVFCTADEAALCDACDHRVHHANKLAGKHHRFSLLLPSSHNQFPLCDICKERRGFLFCQQDRAILCRDCDFPIHKANEHTQNHNRFLLTGVKLSATASVYSSSSDSVPNYKSQKSNQISIEKPVSVNKPAIPDRPIVSAAKTTTVARTTSSISEYLIEALPGWRVEDLLDSSPTSFGFSKSVGDVLPIWDGDLESNRSCAFFSPENIGVWVPQSPAQAVYPTQYPSSTITLGGQMSLKDSVEVINNKSSREWRDNGCFIVPQISLPTTSSKRSRNFW